MSRATGPATPGFATEPASTPQAGLPAAAAATDEARLVERARGGDQAAFGVFAERYGTRLRRLLFRITRDSDAAEDAVQEALTKAWLSVERYEAEA